MTGYIQSPTKKKKKKKKKRNLKVQCDYQISLNNSDIFDSSVKIFMI